jgi:hypothetical protein
MGPSSPFDGALLAVVALMLVAAWVILAGSRFVQGGVVERSDRVPQLYGYTVCLIGLMMAITSFITLVGAAMSLASPLYPVSAEWSGWPEPSVTSFEAYRATYDQARAMRADPGAPQPEPIADPELRRRFEAMRDDRVARTEAKARQTLVTSGLSLLLGVGLLAFHWRWLRRRSELAFTTPAG